MKSLKIGDKEYILEYSFEAAQHKDCVSKIFKMISGGYIGKQGITGESKVSKSELANALVNGTAEMYSEIPDTVISAFYAGLLENNPVTNVKQAKELLKKYFKDNPDDESASFLGMFNLIKECMQDDGFFKLTGMDKTLDKMMIESMKK